MKIGFASNDWSPSAVDNNGIPVMGGSGFIRMGQFMDEFKRMGEDVTLGQLTFNYKLNKFGITTWGGETSFEYDVIVLQRYMNMNILSDLRRAQSTGQIILNDVDDWYWGISPHNVAYAVVSPASNPKDNIDWYENILKHCDGILASTPFLYERMHDWNPNVVLQSNYVKLSLFKPKKAFNKKTKIKVGWVGSTMHRSGDLEVLRPYTEQISEFAVWHHTGHFPQNRVRTFADRLGLSPKTVSTLGFFNPENIGTAFPFDVGIVPLIDIPFTHAKSYVKGLEYAAAGVPFVASWSPQYELLVKKHNIGVLANDPSEYVEELRKFIDPDYRKEMSERGLENVQAFDVSIGAKKYMDNLKLLCINPARS